jgi:Glyoxalase-like domain
VRQIDHLIFTAPDLEDGVREVETLGGVRAAGGGQHLGQGTHNKLLALGPRTYLEIIAPDPAQPEPSRPRPYGVDGVPRSGLVGWAIACEDIDRAHDEALAAGHDPGEVIDGHRLTPDGTMLRWRATSSAGTAGLVLFLISWGTPLTRLQPHRPDSDWNRCTSNTRTPNRSAAWYERLARTSLSSTPPGPASSLASSGGQAVSSSGSPSGPALMPR